LNDCIETRANEFSGFGIIGFDALHLASAEYAKVDRFLTTDKKLISKSNRLNLDFKVMNPIAYIAEALYEF